MCDQIPAGRPHFADHDPIMPTCLAGRSEVQNEANFGQMLAAQRSVDQSEEEWNLYFRMCTDIFFLSKANAGGAVNEVGEPLDAKNPPRFCLFKWISVIEQACPAVALTMQASYSAQATSSMMRAL